MHHTITEGHITPPEFTTGDDTPAKDVLDGLIGDAVEAIAIGEEMVMGGGAPVPEVVVVKKDKIGKLTFP